MSDFNYAIWTLAKLAFVSPFVLAGFYCFAVIVGIYTPVLEGMVR